MCPTPQRFEKRGVAAPSCGLLLKPCRYEKHGPSPAVLGRGATPSRRPQRATLAPRVPARSAPGAPSTEYSIKRSRDQKMPPRPTLELSETRSEASVSTLAGAGRALAPRTPTTANCRVGLAGNHVVPRAPLSNNGREVVGFRRRPNLAPSTYSHVEGRARVTTAPAKAEGLGRQSYAATTRVDASPRVPRRRRMGSRTQRSSMGLGQHFAAFFCKRRPVTPRPRARADAGGRAERAPASVRPGPT